MKKVFVHGALADNLGFDEIELEISSVGEAVRAIEANTGSLYSYLHDKDRDGLKYRVIIGNKDHECDEDLIKTISEEEIHIVPIPMGFKAGARIVAGIVLIAIGAVVSYLGAPVVGAKIMQTGLILIVGGIAELLMPKKKMEDPNQDSSFLFNNQVNTVRQGGPIGLAYGEFICGSHLINFDIISKIGGIPSALGVGVGYSNQDSNRQLDPMLDFHRTTDTLIIQFSTKANEDFRGVLVPNPSITPSTI